MHRFRDDRVRGEGRGSVEILLDRAAEMERWAKSEDRFAGNSYLHPREREAARKEAEKWRKEAAALLERAMKEEAECAADPVAWTGFDVRTPLVERMGALPRYLATKGGSVVSRRHARRRR